MADKIEQELAEGMQDALGVKEMAAKLAPRNAPPLAAYLTPPAASIEMKLQAIEGLIRDIRTMMAHIKGQLG